MPTWVATFYGIVNIPQVWVFRAEEIDETFFFTFVKASHMGFVLLLYLGSAIFPGDIYLGMEEPRKAAGFQYQTREK